MNEPKYDYLVGNVIDQLRTLPDESVHCVVTSPPYWGLRKYAGEQEIVWGGDDKCEHEWSNAPAIRNSWGNPETLAGTKQATNAGATANIEALTKRSAFCKCGAWKGSLGLEPAPEMFVEHLVEIFREVRRVLRNDGVLWLNLGDTYAGSGGAGGDYNEGGLREGQPKWRNAFRPGGSAANGLKAKDLCGIPWLVAFALQADGWWLRSDVIWIKRSCMPENNDGWRWEKHRVNDADCPGCPKCAQNGGVVLKRRAWRPTKAHEYIFMFTKSGRYYCDADAVREVNRSADDYNRRSIKEHKVTENSYRRDEAGYGRDRGDFYNPVGRNHRSYMILGPEPFRGAHFAVFPKAIPTFAIESSTSEAGCCPTCGAPWARITRKVRPEGWVDAGPVTEHDKEQRAIAAKIYGERYNQKMRSLADIFGRATISSINTLGWKATCKCPEHRPVPCTVLDPFAGSGTTTEAAYRLGRDSIGIDISATYMDLAMGRMMKIPSPPVTLDNFMEEKK